jgi:hypothetical protein
VLKNIRNSSFLALLVLFNVGCAGQVAMDDADSAPAHQASPQISAHKPLVVIPQSDCDIRRWYNYQVVAIPVINKRWFEKGQSLEERARRAYTLRHNARINARYMMADTSEVAVLRLRDQAKYGNPDGPTFEYLVNKGKTKGQKVEDIYRGMISSSSRTDNRFNDKCVK